MQENFTRLTSGTRPCLPRRSRAVTKTACDISASQSPNDRRNDAFAALPPHILPCVLRGCTLAIVAALSRPHSAQAVAGRNSWEPRRHFRRLPRSDTTLLQEGDMYQSQSRYTEDRRDGPLVALKSSIQGTVQPLIDAVTGGGRPQDQHERVASVPERSDAHHSAVAARSPVSASAASTIGVAAGGIMLAWLLLRQAWHSMRGSRRTSSGGRWGADRRMAGKETYVPDNTSAVQGGTVRLRQRDMRLSDQGFSRSGTRIVGNRRRQLDREPEWWIEPRPPMYVHQDQKEQSMQTARRLLQQLQESKAEGKAYSIATIVELRETCQSAGISVTPSTDSGRDSIFRTGVNVAAAEAMRSESGRLANLKPPQFVAGLAKDLGVHLGRASQIVHAEIASRVRSMIIDACAAKRSSNTAEHMQQMLRLSALLGQFPLPRDSAEGHIIAASISAKSTLEERQSIFLALGAMAPLHAPLVAELLGFDPELVLPRLEEHTRMINR